MMFLGFCWASAGACQCLAVSNAGPAERGASGRPFGYSAATRTPATCAQLLPEVLQDPDSLYVTRYASGAKKLEIPMRDGSINGIMHGWYEGGEKESELPYQNGIAEGMHVHYYRNGRMKSKTLFIHGLKEGVETLWGDSGQKQKEIPYVHGVAMEPVRVWNETGDALGK